MLALLKANILRQDNHTFRRLALLGAGLILLVLISLTVSARGILVDGIAQYTKQSQRLEWMSSQKSQIEAFRKSKDSKRLRSGESLISIATTTAEQHGISLSRYRPDGDFKVQLSTDKAPLRATLLWVESLQTDHHLTVTSMSLSRGEEKGFCRLEIELHSAGLAQG